MARWSARSQETVVGNGVSSWWSGLHRRSLCSIQWFRFVEPPQCSLATLSVHGDVDPDQTQRHLPRRFQLPRFRVGLVKQVSASGELARPATSDEQTVVVLP